MVLSAQDLAVLLLALALLVAFAHGIGQLFVLVRQPRVIGEIAGGLLLGPTVFGALFPHAQSVVFPSTGPVADVLAAMYQLGLLLLMFCSGAELRSVFRRGDGRAVTLMTLTGSLIPFAAGLLLIRFIDTSAIIGPADSTAALALVFALAVAVTSIPVISRIMHDLGVLHTRFARLVLAVAVIEDTLVYIVLAVALGLAAPTASTSFGVAGLLDLRPGTTAFFVFHVVATLGFFAFMLLVGPRAFRWVLRLRVNLLGRSSRLAYQLVVVFVVTCGCVLLGITPLFGAFLAGIVASTAKGPRAAAARDAIRDFSFAFFVPVYFALVGLQLDLLHHFDLLFFAWFLVLACLVKGFSVWAGARVAGERPDGALNLAVAMNARGGPGIVLASVTYTAGVINQDFFATLVMMAVVTSLLAGSWLGHVVRSGRPLMSGDGVEPDELVTTADGGGSMTP